MAIRQGLATVALCLVLGACAVLGGKDRKGSDHSAPRGSALRHSLNQGYSELYSDAKSLAKVKYILLVKTEDDDVQQAVDNVSGYDKQLAARLEKIAQDFPAVTLHLKPQAPILVEAQSAQRDFTLKQYAPVVGQTGKQFERNLLIQISGIVSYERFLSQVMAGKEPDPALRQILANASTHYQQLYDQTEQLLAARFYR